MFNIELWNSNTRCWSYCTLYHWNEFG